MNSNASNSKSSAKIQSHMPDAETVMRELSSAQSMGDFFGKDGIFAWLFARTMEAMLGKRR